METQKYLTYEEGGVDYLAFHESSKNIFVDPTCCIFSKNCSLPTGNPIFALDKKGLHLISGPTKRFKLGQSTRSLLEDIFEVTQSF